MPARTGTRRKTTSGRSTVKRSRGGYSGSASGAVKRPRSAGASTPVSDSLVDGQHEEESEEIGFAASDDLGPDENWIDITLPMMGKKIRVRYLGTEDIMRFQYMPDLVGMQDLMAEAAALAKERALAEEEGREAPDPKPPTKDEIAKAEEAQWRYMAYMVHLAVVRPEACNNDGTFEMEKCRYCSIEGVEVEHPVSLWTPRQARRMHLPDSSAVGETALKAQSLVAVRPFSSPMLENGISTPPSTGG